MCSGGRLVADFVAGTHDEPLVPELSDNLTMTANGTWVVWAYKLAREAGGGNQFIPLTGRGSYPADAVAECLCAPGPGRRGLVNRGPVSHTAPDPSCTCGFHALSSATTSVFPAGRGVGLVSLTVALSGRVLAFEMGAQLLFRAGRQTVVRVEQQSRLRDPQRRRPGDPSGSMARLPIDHPSGAGPARLVLPSRAARVAVHDDAGWCSVPDEPAWALRSRELVEA
jgi:hypothetical protein